MKKLDKGRGRPNKVIEAMRVEDAGELEGLGALQIAACRGRLEVCRYLVGELRVDVDGVDKKGPFLFETLDFVSDICLRLLTTLTVGSTLRFIGSVL